VVIGIPKKDALGKYWDKEERKPFCSIGDPSQLRALIPVSPADYDLIKTDQAALRKDDPNAGLEVTIRVQGRVGDTWKGQLAELPPSECKDMPMSLTTRGGGSVALKPGSPEGMNTPQNQLYLLSVNFVSPDRAVLPGTRARVKIHCRWHSGAWWAWRTINDTFDLKLM
jgi:hypothetical protein